MASEAAVAKRNTAVLRQQTKIVALSQDNFSKQQIGLSPTHLHRQPLPPHHLLHQPKKASSGTNYKSIGIGVGVGVGVTVILAAIATVGFSGTDVVAAAVTRA